MSSRWLSCWQLWWFTTSLFFKRTARCWTSTADSCTKQRAWTGRLHRDTRCSNKHRREWYVSLYRYLQKRRRRIHFKVFFLQSVGSRLPLSRRPPGGTLCKVPEPLKPASLHDDFFSTTFFFFFFPNHLLFKAPVRYNKFPSIRWEHLRLRL